MIEAYYWLKGVLIGFLVSAPMGPVGLLCVKRVINKGAWQGFATGMGAALGDVFYAALAAFGLTFVMNFLIREERWLRLAGGTFLILLGIIWLRRKRSYADFKKVPARSSHIFEAGWTGFLLDLANPITLIAYIALFSGFGLADASAKFTSAASLVIGIGIGAFAWWFLLTHFILLFRKKITAKTLQVINKVMAVLVIAFGIFVLLTIIFHIKIFGKTF